MGDGFQLADLITGAVAGNVIGGGLANSIQDWDGEQLRELGLEWLNCPDSYIYHQKRHRDRGHAVRRLLTIAQHPNTREPCTAFAVKFPDEYIAYLAKMVNNSVFSGQFCLSGAGFDLDWVQHRTCLAELPLDVGTKLPIEHWYNEQGDFIIAIPYR